MTARPAAESSPPARARRPGWLTPTLLVVSVISLLQDAASELIYPLLPLLVVGVLGAPPAVLGLVEGAATGLAGLVAYVSGRHSDRIGRKPLVFSGYSLAAVGKVFVAAATVWPVVLVGRLVDRLGKGIRGAPRDALITDSVPASALGRAFGFHRAMDTAGAVIGPLLALAALAVFDDDIRTVLWVAVIPAVGSALLVLLIREPRPAPATATTSDGAASSSAGTAAGTSAAPVPATHLGPELRRTLVALTAFALVNFPDALVLLRLSDLGWSSTEVVAGYALYNVAYTAVSFPAGQLADRWPYARVYALGLVFFVTGYLGLGLLDGGPLVLVVLVLYGGFNGCTDGVGKAWVSSLAPGTARGRAQGLFQGLNGGAVLAAGLWAGLLWNAGPGQGVVPLLISGTVGAVAAATFWAMGRRPAPRRPSS